MLRNGAVAPDSSGHDRRRNDVHHKDDRPKDFHLKDSGGSAD
jgi:hypothetical protein